jgi:hypothetical protein
MEQLPRADATVVGQPPYGRCICVGRQAHARLDMEQAQQAHNAIHDAINSLAPAPSIAPVEPAPAPTTTIAAPAPSPASNPVVTSAPPASQLTTNQAIAVLQMANMPVESIQVFAGVGLPPRSCRRAGRPTKSWIWCRASLRTDPLACARPEEFALEAH